MLTNYWVVETAGALFRVGDAEKRLILRSVSVPEAYEPIRFVDIFGAECYMMPSSLHSIYWTTEELRIAEHQHHEMLAKEVEEKW